MRFDLFRSRLLRGIGALAGASLLVLFTVFPAAAGPVRVDLTGHIYELPTDYPYDLIFPGNVTYQSELLGELPVGTTFTASFVYDPFAPATIVAHPNASSTSYQGLVTSSSWALTGTDGTIFHTDGTGDGAGQGVSNDQPGGDPVRSYTDNLYFSDLLSPTTFPGISGDLQWWASLTFRSHTEGDPPAGVPDMLTSQSPPLDLQSVYDRSEAQLVIFQGQINQEYFAFGGELDSITFTPLDVPEPAPIGLMLLGIAYTIRRRLRT